MNWRLRAGISIITFIVLLAIVVPSVSIYDSGGPWWLWIAVLGSVVGFIGLVLLAAYLVATGRQQR